MPGAVNVASHLEQLEDCVILILIIVNIYISTIYNFLYLIF